MGKIKNIELIFPGRKVVPQCPFIQKSLDVCYCTNMKSTRVEEAIYYCGSNYTKCQVYKRLTKKGKAAFSTPVTEKEKAIGL